MRVCFVCPPRPWLVNPHAQAPIGVLYLAAVLQEHGHDVRIVNLAGQPSAVEYPYLRRCSLHIPHAEAYCLTGTWLDVPEVNALVNGIDAWEPNARIIVGGPITLQPDDISEEVDLIVHGEAEEGIVDMCRAADCFGWPTASGALEPRPPSCRIASAPPPDDLDALPFPARHLWPGPFGGNIFIGGENYFGGGSTTILSSRGCPYDCAFCASSALAPRKMRFRSPGNVVEEMEQCVVDFGVRQFRFSDENFNASLQRVEALCDAIMRSDILGHGDGVAWRASIAVRPLSEEALDYMADAGCREVSIGVESADPQVLETICKRKLTDPADAHRAIGMAQRAGLKTRALFMCGTPGENPNTARLNAEFFRATCADVIALTVFTPMPGSDIYDHPERYGCKRRGGDARSVCLYGPDGQHDIEPAIELDGFSLSALRESMRLQVAAAEATGKVGRG